MFDFTVEPQDNVTASIEVTQEPDVENRYRVQVTQKNTRLNIRLCANMIRSFVTHILVVAPRILEGVLNHEQITSLVRFYVERTSYELPEDLANGNVNPNDVDTIHERVLQARHAVEDVQGTIRDVRESVRRLDTYADEAYGEIDEAEADLDRMLDDL